MSRNFGSKCEIFREENKYFVNYSYLFRLCQISEIGWPPPPPWRGWHHICEWPLIGFEVKQQQQPFVLVFNKSSLLLLWFQTVGSLVLYFKCNIYLFSSKQICFEFKLICNNSIVNLYFCAKLASVPFLLSFSWKQ